MKSKSGFTIIELIVTIVIIALLATIATVSLVTVQRQARDSRRSSNASTVVEALEKYFTHNGEYPSVPKVTSSNGSSVQSLLGLQSIEALIAPNATSGTTNSWGTGQASATNPLTYSGNTDTSASCATGTSSTDSCTDYKIQYYNEQDGTVTTLYSRHTTPVGTTLTPDAPVTAPTVTVTYSSPNIVASWTAAACSTGTPQYAYQNRTNDGTWSAWSAWQTATSATTSPSEGTKFGYQVKAECIISSQNSTDSPTSTEATYIQPITTVPSAPAPYTTQSFRPYGVSGSVCIDAAGGGGAGTNVQIYGCNGTSSQDWAWNSNDGTIRPTYNTGLCINMNGHGVQLTLATCNGSNTQQWSLYNDGTFHSISGGYCMDDANFGTNNTNPIQSWDCNGATAQVWSPTDTQSAATWPNVTCNGSATPQYQVNYQTTGLSDSGWSNIGSSNRVVFTDVNQGYTYNTQAQARCVSAYTNGNWSATGQASVVKAIITPTTPSGFSFGENASNRANITWWWTFNMSCGPGTNLYYQEDDWLSGPGNPVYWVSPRVPNGVGAVGWWTANATSGAPYIIYGPNPTLKNTSSYYSSAGTQAPTNSVQTQNRVQGYCQNPVTGRTGLWSPWGTSAAVYI